MSPRDTETLQAPVSLCGHIDVMVNNAGTFNELDWEPVVQLNFVSNEVKTGRKCLFQPDLVKWERNRVDMFNGRVGSIMVQWIAIVRERERERV